MWKSINYRKIIKIARIPINIFHELQDLWDAIWENVDDNPDEPDDEIPELPIEKPIKEPYEDE